MGLSPEEEAESDGERAANMIFQEMSRQTAEKFLEEHSRWKNDPQKSAIMWGTENIITKKISVLFRLISIVTESVINAPVQHYSWTEKYVKLTTCLTKIYSRFIDRQQIQDLTASNDVFEITVELWWMAWSRYTRNVYGWSTPLHALLSSFEWASRKAESHYRGDPAAQCRKASDVLLIPLAPYWLPDEELPGWMALVEAVFADYEAIKIVRQKGIRLISFVLDALEWPQ